MSSSVRAGIVAGFLGVVFGATFADAQGLRANATLAVMGGLGLTLGLGAWIAFRSGAVNALLGKRARGAPPRARAWPRNTPRLYPDLDGVAIARMIDEETFERLLELPLVAMLPLGEGASPTPLGVGLSRLLIRALMLVPDLSVHGPEDTPRVPLEEIEGPLHERTAYVGGHVARRDGRVSAELVVRSADRKPQRLTVPPLPLQDFVPRAAEIVAKALGGHPGEEAREGWRSGLPSGLEAVVRLGELVLENDANRTPRTIEEQALQLAQEEPSFALPYHLLEAEQRTVAQLLQGLERDPHDAQLCFSLFGATWRSDGRPQPEAVQFIRRALELSPGHGKAHMCAPHAAPRDVAPELLFHSELGYTLLPGNSFAINNYIYELQRSRRPAAEIVPLALEAILADPDDPIGYDRAVELLVQAGDVERALLAARQLVAVYEAMSPRTAYCIRQNPQRAAELDAGGEYRPLEDARRRVKKLEKSLRGRR